MKGRQIIGKRVLFVRTQQDVGLLTTIHPAPAAEVARDRKKPPGSVFFEAITCVKNVLVMGRKRKENNRLEYRVFTRISKEKYEELEKLLQGSRCKTISELLRHILEDEKIVVEYYDSGLDKVMEQLSHIRKELHATGININQLTRYFHGAKTPEAKLYNAMEIAKLYQQTDLKITELFSVVAKLSEIWLPK